MDTSSLRTIHQNIQAQWYSIESVAQILGVSLRTARTRVAAVDPRLIRLDKSPDGGRPSHHYHYTALPELTAYYRHATTIPEQVAEQQAAAQGIAPDDLARAQLRLTCVFEYMARARAMTKEEAAELTASDWSGRPRTKAVVVKERIGRITRTHEQQVDLGSVAAKTIRAWAGIWERERKLAALAPQRKGNSGRKVKEIPEDLLNLVLANSVSTARADITKGVELAARMHQGGDFPDVSIRTWQRRIKALDPAKVMAMLGKKGNAALELHALPDIERDYDLLHYNEEWQIDDVQMDFYAHTPDNPELLCRPWLYLIRRASTRQIVSYVVSHRPINKDQVAGLLGLAFSDPGGGIPDHITFERGAVALSEDLASLLDCIGVRYTRASVHGGRTWSGALEDAPAGNSRAKAMLEANNRRLHNILWQQVANVGPEERHTSHANTETIKRESVARVRAGEASIFPLWHQVRDVIDAAIREDNAKPHSGLPRVWDAQLQRHRYQSPDERAIALKADAVRMLDPFLIPAFFAEGARIPVTRNGFQIGRDHNARPIWYGRNDTQLLALNGTKVTVYVMRDMPGQAYVLELGRCVARYRKAAPLAPPERQFEVKGQIRNQHKERFESLMADKAAREQEYIESIFTCTADPAANDRQTTTVQAEQLRQRLAALNHAHMADAVEREQIRERTSMPADRRARIDAEQASEQQQPERRRKRSILDIPAASRFEATQAPGPRVREDEQEDDNNSTAAKERTA